ncbi:MAG: hypothetical protein EF813_03555 [Methanosarcinales archaeon]|nr:MAG: hypothetical protein EF813_03555 [Methanosarcinales archaeon]
MRSIIIAAIVMIGTISAAYAAPIVVSGQVVYEDDSVCNNPAVDIENLDTGIMGLVETNESSNEYSATLDNVSINDTLQFTATSPDESQSSVTEHVITQDEINAEVLTHNINLMSPEDITPPEIISVILDPAEEVEADGLITVTVTATDDSGIASVTADGTELVAGDNDTYVGEIVAVSAPGEYTVAIVVTDASDNNNTATAEATYTVPEDPGDIILPEIISVLLDPAEVEAGELITVTVTATDDSGIASVTADCTELVPGDNNTYVGGIVAVSAPGVYTVTIVATDASDNNNTATDSVTYEVILPVVLSIEDVEVRQGESKTVPILVSDVVAMEGCTINFVYDPAVICVTEVTRGDMNFSFEYNINNGSGWMQANALDVNGVSGDVVFAHVTLRAVGNKSDTSEMVLEDSQLVDASFGEIAHEIDNGVFSIVSNVRPVVSNVSATLDTILYDNGRPRATGTDISLLNAYVTDEDGNVTEVTIDLSSIGGSSTHPMNHVAGDMWTTITNATEVGVNVPDFVNQLTITATDNDGGISDPVSIELTVLKRGDVNMDGYVNKMDADYMSRYLAGLEPEVSLLVGDVVGEAGEPMGDGVVDLVDALYIAKYTEGMVEEP